MKLGMTEGDYRRLTSRLYEGYGYKKKKQGGIQYTKPPGWEKPESYPGLKGPEHKNALDKGFLNLGLLDPETVHEAKKDHKLSAAIFRNIVRILVQESGYGGIGLAYISDPEWVLKKVYPGAMIKTVLAVDIAEALDDLFEPPDPIDVWISLVKKVPSIGGSGWKVTASDLKLYVKEDALTKVDAFFSEEGADE